SMADRIAVLRDGRVVQHGTARELYDTPADPQLACFLGEANLLDARLTSGGADVGPLGLLPVLPECGGGCAESESEKGGATSGATALIRPEQFAVDVCDDAADAASAQAGMPGRGERGAYYGHAPMRAVPAPSAQAD